MISLRRYFETLRRDDQEALRVAKGEIDRRLEAMNQLREQITAERNHYVSGEIYEARHQALINLIEANTNRLSANERALATLQARLPAISGLVALLSAGLGAAVLRVIGG